MKRSRKREPQIIQLCRLILNFFGYEIGSMSFVGFTLSARASATILSNAILRSPRSTPPT